MRPRRGLACGAALLGALLAGCSVLFRSTAQPEQTYYLRPPAAAATADGAATASPEPMAASVRVSHLSADPGLDSPHIMLVQADHRLNFYTGSRWAGPAPDVIESLTVQTLRASGQWASVEDSRSSFPANYLLQIAVRRFDADYTGGGAAPEVRVVLDCIIGRRDGREVVKSFVASGSAPAAANRLAEVVSAFERAAGTALTQLAQQAAQAARADSERAAQNAAQPAPSSSRPSQ